jgi:hypothetical protein
MSRVSLLGAAVFFLVDGVIRWAWTDAGPAASSNRASLVIFAGAICGLAWLTVTARQMAQERAAREAAERPLPMRGD